MIFLNICYAGIEEMAWWNYGLPIVFDTMLVYRYAASLSLLELE